MDPNEWLHPKGLQGGFYQTAFALTTGHGLLGLWRLSQCARRPSSSFLLHRSRLVFSATYLAISAAALVSLLWQREPTEAATSRQIRPAFLLATLVKAAIFSILVFVPTFSSCIALDAILGCIAWGLIFLVSPYPEGTGSILSLLYLCVLLELLALEGDYASQGQSNILQHPLACSSPVAAVTLSWLDPLIKLGASGPISLSQLWNVDSQLSVRSGLEEDAHTRKSLLGMLVSRFPKQALTGAMLAAVDLSSTLIQPFLLQTLLIQRSYSSLAAMFIVGILGGFCGAHSTYRMRRLGLRLRPCLTSMISSKSLRGSATRSKDAPQTSVLLESDLPQIHEFIEQSNLLWLVPAQLIVSMGALCLLLGWKSVAAGSALAIIAVPLLGEISSTVSIHLKNVMIARDARVSEVTHTLKQARQVKLHAWTTYFANRIGEKRDHELKKVKSVAVCNTSIMLIVSILPVAFGFAIFATHVVLNRDPLRTEVVFPSLAFLFNISRAVSLLPQIIMSFQTARVSWGRVQLSLAESEGENHNSLTHYAMNLEPKVILRAVTLGSLEPSFSEESILKDCNLEASRGSLTVITGAIGSGKSTLLRAIVQDIRPYTGVVQVDGRIAYSAQAPNIIRGTIRDNILFGLPLDETHYRRVLDAVALTSDLARLPSGDATFLGGTGVTLSGGQKSRVCLARAIYSRREIVVLDDPIAAVDAKVQSHLIREVLGPGGILKDTIRVVVTSSPALIRCATQVYQIKDGTLIPSSFDGVDLDLNTRTEVEIDSELRTSDIEQPFGVETSSRSSYRTVESENDTLMTTRSQRGSLDEETPLLERKQSANDGGLLNVPSVEMTPKTGPYLQYLKAAAPGGWLVVMVLAALWKVCDVVGIWALRVATDQPTISAQLHSLAFFILCGFLGSLCVVSFMLCAWFLCVIPASRHFHARLTSGVLQGEMAFFDSTPIGEILSRFTNDMQKLDNQVAGGFIRVLSLAAALVSSVMVLLSTSMLSIFYLIPLIFTYWIAQSYYLRTCRQMRQLENAARGPILDAAGEISATAAVIRSYDQSRLFEDRLNDAIDDHVKVWGPFLCLDIWLRLRLQVLSSILMLLAAALILYLQLPSGTLGLALNFVLQITQILNIFVQARSNLDADITSVERILAFTSLTPEDKGRPIREPPATWPASPSVAFQSFTAGYKPQDPPCLHHLDFSIYPEEHVAIVGRTGAGKSSLIQSLLGAIPTNCIQDGKVLVGGVDISTLSLTGLRQRVSLIPQEPLIFSGTLRENLDPLNQHDDADIGRVVSICRIPEGLSIGHLKDPLTHYVDPLNGALSAGQAQMVALARAVLMRNKIVILDEATAAVDQDTVKILEEVMRREFRGCTVLAITHSIQTSLAYDRVIVLEQGEAIEIGAPMALLKDPNSAFAKLAASTD